MSPTSYRAAPLRDKKKEVAKVAGVQGFEPQLTGPKPAVLPLDDTPMCFGVGIIAKRGFVVKL